MATTLCALDLAPDKHFSLMVALLGHTATKPQKGFARPHALQLKQLA